MSYLALYREWRPRTFDEVVEQKHAVYALRQAVISGQIGHAYLFSGTRGTGKTTLAKIFSRAINCLSPQDGNPCNQCEVCRGVLDGSLLDVVEMDAASNNSVDNIRRITDEVNFMPARARFKVYIIDEVHMLTPGAFNALLKTLEEPPAHAVFILATTEPHRIPATILSRCQRYDFRRIPVESIAARLREIAASDGIAIDESGLETIAAFADGALRDAISLLDQARMSCQGTVTRDDILTLAGLAKDDALLALAGALIKQKAAEVLDLIDQLVMAGRDLARLIPDLAQLFRNLLVCQVSDRPEKLVQTTADGLTQMKRLASQANQPQLLTWIRGLSALLPDLRWAADTRTVLEIGLLRLMADSVSDGISADATTRIAPKSAPKAPVLSAPDQSTRTPDPVIQTAAPVVSAPVVSAPVLPDPADGPLSMTSLASEVPPFQDEPPFPDEPPFLDEPLFPEDPSFPEVSPTTVKSTRSDQPPALDVPPVASVTSQTNVQPVPIAPVSPFDQPTPSLTADVSAEPESYDGAALWQRVLGHLSENGQMTLFLFGRSAKVEQVSSHRLTLRFASSERVHYDEFRSASAQKTLRDTLKTLTDQIFEFDVRLVDQTAPEAGPTATSTASAAVSAVTSATDSDWVTRLQTTAESFGIPITLEE